MKKGVVILVLISLIFVSFLSFVSAGSLQVTPEHPFLINNSWIYANQLKVGDLLTTIDGKQARITSIEDVKLNQSVLVYNLEDDYFHNYIISKDNLIVHNSLLNYIKRVCAFDLKIDTKIASINTVEDYLRLPKVERVNIRNVLQNSLDTARNEIAQGDELPFINLFREVTGPAMQKHIANVQKYSPQVAETLGLDDATLTEFNSHIAHHDYTKGSRIFDILDSVLRMNKCDLEKAGFTAEDWQIALDSIKDLTNQESHHNIGILLSQYKAGKISEGTFLTRLAENGVDSSDAAWFRRPPGIYTFKFTDITTLMNDYQARLGSLKPQIIDAIGQEKYNNFISALQNTVNKMITENPR